MSSWLVLLSLVSVGCGEMARESDPARAPEVTRSRPAIADPTERARMTMVERTIAAQGVTDAEVLAAMRTVPRHLFVAPTLVEHAYDDSPLPIGSGQTMSRPYIVALIAELAQIDPGDRVLEIGTGSGYLTAILDTLGADVWSFEIDHDLAESAARRLGSLGYSDVHLREGDGYHGLSEAAPFDAIVVTAAALQMPEPLVAQLAIGGRIVAPIGDGGQELVVWTKTADGIERRSVLPVRFAPMRGEAQR